MVDGRVFIYRVPGILNIIRKWFKLLFGRRFGFDFRVNWYALWVFFIILD